MAENREEIAQKAKIYYANHREIILQRAKEYNANHKEEIAQRQKEKYTCVCGSINSIKQKARHERTKKHKKFIEKTVQSSPSQMTGSEQP
jgi:crotonobetainyl-CoA:carnitine CoA-transferase CaiB-like acyl-CoA transferase